MIDMKRVKQECEATSVRHEMINKHVANKTLTIKESNRRKEGINMEERRFCPPKKPEMMALSPNRYVTIKIKA